MTPIEKVLEALKDGGMAKAKLLGKEYNPFDCEIQKSISELEGMVIVPVEPTDEQIQKGWRKFDKFAKPENRTCNMYRAMIAPYLPEVEND